MEGDNRIDFRFPFQPYPIQEKLMKTLYNVLEKGEVGLFESPTGTGKTLSLLCGSLAWLLKTSKLPDDFSRQSPKPSDNQRQIHSTMPSWLVEETDEELELKEKRENQEFQLRKLTEALEKYEAKKEQPWFAKSVPPSLESSAKRQRLEEDDEDLLLDTPIHDFTQSEESPIPVTKIYYCSRTHTQLSQVHDAFLQSAWSKEFHCCVLGGRKTYCMNNDVNRLSSDTQISERCLYLQRNRSRGKSGCPYHNRQNEEYLRNEIILHNLDIEDLKKCSNDLQGCGYYGTRYSIPYIELVLLPYNLIINKPSREALGIDLHNQVVVFDEGHNVINTILDIYSPKVTLNMINQSHTQLQAYYKKYEDRLSSLSHSYLIHLLFILKQIIAYLQTAPKVTQVYSTDRFLQVLKFEDVNIFDIAHFVINKQIIHKLNGFVDRQQDQDSPATSFFPSVFTFITSLTSSRKDSRIIVNTTGKEPFVQLLFLNPGVHFQEIVNEARSVVIAGGTLQPFDELKTQLFMGNETPRTITTLSLPHILPSNHIKCVFCELTETKRELHFDYSQRNDKVILEDLVKKLLLLCEVVPRGMVVFFPSFSFLQDFVRFLHVNQFYSQLNELKCVFVDQREQNVFSAYSACVREHGGAILFAVIGGRLSEGINFSDDLGRCVMVVGMPYPNKTDVVLQEKMKYLEEQESGLGAKYYQNLCIKAVNQAIGRAFRHQKDWASVVFMDCRYTSQGIRSGLTRWIEQNGSICNSNELLRNVMTSFYQEMSAL